MLSLPRTLLVLALSFTLASAASSSSHASAKSSSAGDLSSAGGSSSNSIGTPSNSAALPNLSDVPSCVSNCLVVAAGAAGCQSEVAVDCFCPSPGNYTTAFLSCLNACPSEVASAEALVEQICAAASTPTSLSFASFTPSSSALSVSNSAISNSNSGSSVSSTAPPSSSAPNSPSSSAPSAATAVRFGIPLLPLSVSAAGVLLGALVVL